MIRKFLETLSLIASFFVKENPNLFVSSYIVLFKLFIIIPSLTGRRIF